MFSGNNLTQKLYRYKAHHILFWVCYYIFWVAVYADLYEHLGILAAITGTYIIFHATGFYITAYLLVPRFLYRQRLIQFAEAVLLLFLICGGGITGGILLITGNELGAFSDNWLYLFFVTTFSTFSIVGILTAAKVIAERYRSRQEAERIKKENLETELKFLKSQVNPHFLFNVINSINVLIHKNPDHASEALVKLSQMLRFQLYECSDDTIEIQKEITYLKTYIDLEKLRKGNQIKVRFKADSKMNGYRIAPFLLIPFLENAFKYVSGFKNRENTIDITLSLNDDIFHAYFSNTTENESNNINPREGIGIKNVKRRLNLLYPEQHTLDIQEDPDRFTVSLKLMPS